MVVEKRELRSWRERLATPLKGPGRENQEETASTNPTNQQTPVSLRVGLLEGGQNIPKQTPALPRQRLVRTGSTTWVEAEWARRLCVNCDEPTAPGDLIACAEHRRQLDAILMPWDAEAP